jgi:deoxyribodipyrimidine photo-lyase
VGTIPAWEALLGFEAKLNDYEASRDYPNVRGTSKLSIHLRYGCLSTAQIIAHLKLVAYEKKSCSRDVYFSELIWREFYHHVLYHFPHVEKEAFLRQYREIAWANDEEWFAKWKDGRTGFPIVDAGMQELKKTGWMHNRVRMIVASFLCKDLLIDWKWGEQYFMEQLLDGDLAANNGGWQWAASTGCDAQPYFRIFNPWRQSERFDSKAGYIKEMIPSLRTLAPKKCHAPILDVKSYPEPLVDHRVQREKALKMYKGDR